MNKTWYRRYWWGIAGLFLLPWVVFFVAATVLLYFHAPGWLFAMLVGGAAVNLLACWLMGRLRKAGRSAPWGAREPMEFPPLGAGAWDAVEKLAGETEAQDFPLDKPETLLPVLRGVLEAVARHYHPRSRQPLLETPLPHLFRVLEMAAKDVRRLLLENVPGSHLLTLGDLHRLRRAGEWFMEGYLLWKVAALAADPVAGVVREVRDAVGERESGRTANWLKQQIVGYFVRRVGYYAILLYSGELVLDPLALPDGGEPDDDEAIRRRLAEEPVRILVAGQTKAGKSSLVNAIAGEYRAAVDVVPCTEKVERHVVRCEDLPPIVFLDTAGFGDSTARRDAFAALRDEILQSDFVLFVCSAVNAAREEDRRLLNSLWEYYGREARRLPPPVLVVLTHIDLLRPLAQWDPPYDLSDESPDGNEKARNVREAVLAAAADLQIGTDRIVPVCLREDRVYNVDEALVPAILAEMNAAKRVQFLRIVKQADQRGRWLYLWRQARRTGRVVVGLLKGNR